jgi:hypothetical protein
MSNKIESGKSRVIKGSMRYLWEELKTMNRYKFKALSKIVSGFVKMKFSDNTRKRTGSDFSLDGR